MNQSPPSDVRQRFRGLEGDDRLVSNLYSATCPSWGFTGIRLLLGRCRSSCGSLVRGLSTNGGRIQAPRPSLCHHLWWMEEGEGVMTLGRLLLWSVVGHSHSHEVEVCEPVWGEHIYRQTCFRLRGESRVSLMRYGVWSGRGEAGGKTLGQLFGAPVFTVRELTVPQLQTGSEKAA